MPDEQLSGTDLDAAVAQAFGVQPTFTWEVFNEDETATMIGFDREHDAREWFDNHPHAQKEHHVGKLAHYPPYSESIEAAMWIAEKFIDMGGRVSLRGMRFVADGLADEYKPGWRVNFYRFRRDVPAGTRFSFDEESESLPEAICRAALAALKTVKQKQSDAETR